MILLPMTAAYPTEQWLGRRPGREVVVQSLGELVGMVAYSWVVPTLFRRWDEPCATVG